MFKKKCPSCAKKIDRKFGYCPWCGEALKALKEREDFGMLGRDDFVEENNAGEQIKLPFGLNKIMESLMKQLDKEMGKSLQNQGRANIPK